VTETQVKAIMKALIKERYGVQSHQLATFDDSDNVEDLPVEDIIRLTHKLGFKKLTPLEAH